MYVLINKVIYISYNITNIVNETRIVIHIYLRVYLYLINLRTPK